MLLVGFLIFSLSIFVNSQSDKNIFCNGSSSTITIPSGDYVSFRTPEFPKTILYCYKSFHTVDNNYLWVAIYNGATGELDFNYDSIYIFNSNTDALTYSTSTNNLNFGLVNSSSVNWNAFEAVVLSYNSVSHCPFAENPITLDETMVIPIASDFGYSRPQTSCTWTFTINTNLKLKVVIKKMKSVNGIALKLKTDGNNLDSFTQTVTPENPEIFYYNSTSGIFQFDFVTGNTNGSNFLVFVSAVTKNDVYLDAPCNATVIDNIATVSNFDADFGYSTYEKCEHTFSIGTKQELRLHVDNLSIERNVDKLFIKNTTNEIQLNDALYYHLLHGFDGSILQFISDGNTQQAGFILHYNIIECVCATSSIVIPCEGATIYPTPNDAHYCSDMQCPYYITNDPNCPTDHFIVQLNLNLRSNQDYIDVVLNGDFNEKLTGFNTNKKVYSFKSKPEFQFNSPGNLDGTTSFDNVWSINIGYGNKPNNLLNHNLTAADPTYVIWLDDMNKNDAITICGLASQPLEIIMSSFKCFDGLSNYGLYDFTNLENFVFNFDSPSICTSNGTLLKKTSTSGCFTIYKIDDTLSVKTTLLFRLPQIHKQYCNIENVVQIRENSSALTFSGFQTDIGSCEIIVLTATYSDIPLFGVQIQGLNFASSLVFKSAINQNKYLDLVSSDKNGWLPLSFYIPALSIVIPPNSYLNFSAIVFTDYIYVQENWRAILASPSYGGFTRKYDDIDLFYWDQYYNNAFYFVRYLSSDMYLYLSYFPCQGWDCERITQRFQPNINLTEGTNINVYVGMNEPNPMSGGFLIEFYNLDYDPTATTIAYYTGITYPPSQTYPQTTTTEPLTFTTTEPCYYWGFQVDCTTIAPTTPQSENGDLTTPCIKIYQGLLVPCSYNSSPSKSGTSMLLLFIFIFYNLAFLL